MSTGWIGVDLDGTLAEYTEWKGVDHVGDPIPEMLERVKRWVAEGREVKIMTARVSHDGTRERYQHAKQSYAVINLWILKHVGVELEITCIKDFRMLELWDDRAVTVEANTGRPLAPSSRGFE